MLRAQDIPAGKILVQLGFIPANDVLSEIRALDTGAAETDLLDHLVGKRKLSAEQAAKARDKLSRFKWIRDEASYINVLNEEALADKALVQKLLLEIERRGAPVRVGAVLVA